MMKITPMNRAEKEELQLMIEEEVKRRNPDRALVVSMKMMQKIADLEVAVVEMQKEVFK